MIRGNIYELKPGEIRPEKEIFNLLFEGDNCRVERIISSGHTTPEGSWYDQEMDEWVILLQGTATIEFADGQVATLKDGDYIFISAHQRHRVIFTSVEPPCFWLAIHGKINMQSVE